MEPYRVPFLFDRTNAPRYRLVNIGAERVTGISVTLLGSGAMAALEPAGLEPTEALELVIHGDDLARDSVLVVRWLRPSGEDWLWRVAF